jgi:uncharacterized integral membrane protein
MSILKRFMVLLFVAVILLLGIFNAAETVTIKLGFIEYPDAPLPVVMVVLFLLGALFMYLFSIAREISLRNDIRKLKRTHGKMDREIQNLRNLSIDEDFQEDAELSKTRDMEDGL